MDTNNKSSEIGFYKDLARLNKAQEKASSFALDKQPSSLR
jgi:hypothetical protein